MSHKKYDLRLLLAVRLIVMSVAVFPQVKGIGSLSAALFFQGGVVLTGSVHILMSQDIRYQIDVSGLFVEFGTVGTA